MRKVLFFVTILSILMTATSAMALLNTSFDLTIGNTSNPGIAGFPSPYVRVTFDAIAENQLQVTFAGIDTHNGYDYDLGRQGAVALNLISGVTLFSISTPDLEAGGDGTEDGFGNFNFSLDPVNGHNQTNWETIQFILTRNTGSFEYLSDVLTPNSKGYVAAAHVVVNAVGMNEATGYAADGQSTSVPEPGTMILLGFGLLGLYATTRKSS